MTLSLGWTISKEVINTMCKLAECHFKVRDMILEKSELAHNFVAGARHGHCAQANINVFISYK